MDITTGRAAALARADWVFLGGLQVTSRRLSPPGSDTLSIDPHRLRHHTRKRKHQYTNSYPPPKKHRVTGIFSIPLQVNSPLCG